MRRNYFLFICFERDTNMQLKLDCSKGLAGETIAPEIADIVVLNGLRSLPKRFSAERNLCRERRD